MSGRVPPLSLGCMALAALLCVALPIGLLIRYKKKGAAVLPFFVGCGVFVVFALILEALVHNIVLKQLPVGQTIQGNTLLYALYGGLMAGLFEETGRFLAFKTVLKKRLENDKNALMYGAGHGGAEAILLLGVTYGSYVVMGILANAGRAELLTAGQPEAAAEQVQSILGTLSAAPAWTYLMGFGERVIAIAFHISASVLVWFAAKKPGKIWLYPLAILLHAAIDALAVLLAARLPLLAVEGALALFAVAVALLARGVWRRNRA